MKQRHNRYERIIITLWRCLYLSIAMATCNAQENLYTFRNNSDVEIKVSLWFTKSLQGMRKEKQNDVEVDALPALRALPLPDFQIILQPSEQEVVSYHDSHVTSDECLAYLAAEFRAIPSVTPTKITSGIVQDLFLVGRRYWYQKMPGLCGNNLFELNYDPATYLKFSLIINGVQDEFRDLTQQQS